MTTRMSILVVISLVSSFLVSAQILPPNDLYLEDRLDRKDANLTEVIFNEITDRVGARFAPFVSSHGAKLVMNKSWLDSTVNAYASRDDQNNWMVDMFGGLARRPEVTLDGYVLVICHELGHHLAGYAFKGARWAATEGQSDYFSTQVCARELWKDEAEVNSIYRDLVSSYVKQKCDASWVSTADQDLCYRTAAAGQSLANLLAYLSGGKTPAFETPDPSAVKVTYEQHPKAQCRLDTYLQGSVCSASFDLAVIPGVSQPEGQQSKAAEEAAARASCMGPEGFQQGLRPVCWFKPIR